MLDNSEKSVWSFTLRDSPSDFLNVTVWGSVDYIKNLNESHRVGDVGKFILHLYT